MQKVRFETMTPAELTRLIKGRSLVYQPVGSMEWHGPHMGMGMDTANAEAVALRAARRTGGAVMPPLYMGTETPRPPEALKKLGFQGGEHIVGMDFPNNSVKSHYWPPELFEAVITQQLAMLADMGFRQIVVVNGHGANRQLDILARVCEALSQERGITALSFMALEEGCGAGLGHAGLAETAIFLSLCPEAVDLSQLPPRGVKLKNTEYAIVDSETFQKGPTPDHTVRYDPRDATARLGEQIVDYTANRCASLVEAAWTERHREG